jgi:micrococcal nuclease
VARGVWGDVVVRAASGFVVLLASVAVAACDHAASVADLPSTTTARVVRAVDGDTIVADVGGGERYVRYIGIDTPETVKPDTPVQCFGPQASDFNHRTVEGHTVRLVFGAEREDAYGRLLAYVYLDGHMVNAELARKGLARTLPFPPNTAHAPLFDRLARHAALRGRGLWGDC